MPRNLLRTLLRNTYTRHCTKRWALCSQVVCAIRLGAWGNGGSMSFRMSKPKTAVQHKLQYLRDAGKLQIRVNKALDEGVLIKNFLDKDNAYAPAYKKKAASLSSTEIFRNRGGKSFANL